MIAALASGSSILYRAAASADPFPDPYLAAIAKMQVNEMAIKVTVDALHAHSDALQRPRRLWLH